jgi:hypothetical protein
MEQGPGAGRPVSVCLAEHVMSTSSGAVVGIAWYRPERYERIREVMADGVSFPKTHASWGLKARRMERELRRQGFEPARVDVDPDEFARWCAGRDIAPDSAARDGFVQERLATRRGVESPPGS